MTARNDEALRALSGTMCVVTGGLGFIGSNLVHTLVRAGAKVRVIDALVAEHGGRHDNLDGLPDNAVECTVASIDDIEVGDIVADADVVFNVAGQVSHIASMRDPLRDLHLNATSHATFLETLRSVNRRVRVVHTSTRQVYGRPVYTPVDELHPTHPVDVNGVAKLAGEHLHLVYAHAHQMAITSVRLTNVYGPRQRLTSDELGFLPVFIRRALNGEAIHIYGDGEQRRDCLHVDDAVAALLIAATSDAACGEVYNVGHVEDHSLAAVAAMIVDAARSSALTQFTPWPDDHARVDIGSIHTDGAKIADALGWRAEIEFSKGIASTLDFYRERPWYLSST